MAQHSTAGWVNKQQNNCIQNSNPGYHGFVINKIWGAFSNRFSKNRLLTDTFRKLRCQCLCPLLMSFFLGLSLALRSHDQLKASHWSNLSFAFQFVNANPECCCLSSVRPSWSSPLWLLAGSRNMKTAIRPFIYYCVEILDQCLVVIVDWTPCHYKGREGNHRNVMFDSSNEAYWFTEHKKIISYFSL